MKKAFITLALAITSIAALPSHGTTNVLVVDGKPYEIRPTQHPTCGTVGSAEQASAKFALDFAQSNGEGTYISACKAGIQTKCTTDDIKRFGFERIFSMLRKFESGLTNEACKQVRKECEDRCVSSKLYDDRHCLIECNQYETWNR